MATNDADEMHVHDVQYSKRFGVRVRYSKRLRWQRRTLAPVLRVQVIQAGIEELP